MGCATEQAPARRVAPPLQFQRKHQACELGLPVRLPWRVHARALQVVEINEGSPVRQAAEADDARRACPAQQRHQPGRERKVAQMVGAELHLEAIGRGLPARQRHHACIVDQEIKGRPGLHPLCEVSDR
jgi:hypothetical protein